MTLAKESGVSSVSYFQIFMQRSAIWFLLAFSFVAGGCSDTLRNPDIWPTQPYMANGEVAKSLAVRKVGIPFNSTGEILWSDSALVNGKEFFSRKVANKIEQYFDENSEFGSGSIDWDHQRIIINEWTDVVIEQVENNPLSTSRYNTIYTGTLVVCCLDPLVVVYAPVPLGTAYINENFNAFPAADFAPELLGESSSSMFVTMPNGITYGQVIPVSDNMYWFDPVFKSPPVPLVFNADGIAVVDVYWGSLEFVLKGQRCIVQSVQAKP